LGQVFFIKAGTKSEKWRHQCFSSLLPLLSAVCNLFLRFAEAKNKIYSPHVREREKREKWFIIKCALISFGSSQKYKTGAAAAFLSSRIDVEITPRLNDKRLSHTFYTAYTDIDNENVSSMYIKKRGAEVI